MATVRDLSGNGTPYAESTGGLQALVEGVKANANTGTPVPITDVQTLVRSVKFTAQKGQGSANTGDISLGFTSVDGAQTETLAPAGSFILTAGENQKIDLNKVYLDVATANDAVTWMATR